MRRDFAKDSDCEDYHPRRVYERKRLPQRHIKLTPAHIDLAHTRKAAGVAVCIRSSRRRRTSAHANSLPNPLISGPRNAGALNGYRIAESRGRVGVLNLPSLVRRSLSFPRVLSFPFRCSLVHSSPSSLFLTRFAHSFLVPFLPFRPEIVPHPTPVDR